MTIRRDGPAIEYVGRRRWPTADGVGSRIAVRVGPRADEPTELEHFLTARWRLHNAPWGRPVAIPNEHPRWPLFRAELVHCEENMIEAAGLPAPEGQPVSVLFSPGVRVRFGLPYRR